MGKIYNWDDIQENKYINEEGSYTLKVIDVLKDENGNVTQTTPNGKEFHKFLCETKDKELINLSLYLNDKALWRYKIFANACGVSTKGQFDLDSLPFQLVGKFFKAEVKRQPAKQNVVTGVVEESKYFEITKFESLEG